jgi:hypothetical protein
MTHKKRTERNERNGDESDKENRYQGQHFGHKPYTDLQFKSETKKSKEPRIDRILYDRRRKKDESQGGKCHTMMYVKISK